MVSLTPADPGSVTTDVTGLLEGSTTAPTHGRERLAPPSRSARASRGLDRAACRKADGGCAIVGRRTDPHRRGAATYGPTRCPDRVEDHRATGDRRTQRPEPIRAGVRARL